MCRLMRGMIPFRVVDLCGPLMVRAALAAWSASSFPGIPQWPGTHCIQMVESQEDSRFRRWETA